MNDSSFTPSPPPPGSAESSALVLNGLARRFGDLLWPHPTQTFVTDRAQLLAMTLPHWAVAAGPTAGWVWTGMGLPQPWSLLYRSGPQPSPLSRTQWKPRQRVVDETAVRVIRGLALLSPGDTVQDLLIAPGSDDLAVAPLYVLLENASPSEVASLAVMAHRSATARERALRRLALLRQWRTSYA